MHRKCLCRVFSFVVLFCALPLAAEDMDPFLNAIKPEINASFGMIPLNNWSSGTFWALSEGDAYFDRLHYRMETTAFTSYSGSVYFPKAGVSFGVNLDVDANLIGKLDRIMGFFSVDGFTGRIQSSVLRGTATWVGNTLPVDHPTSTTFDNRFLNVDLLRVIRGGDAGISFGIGYTSFSLPVQLDLLTLDASGDVVSPKSWTYQENMDFHIYSILFGMNDPLDSAVMGREDANGRSELTQGFFIWLYDMDRFGVGVAHVSDYEKGVIETITNQTLAGQDSLAMVVDFDMTIGIRWLGKVNDARVGFGIGYRFGGDLVLSLPLTGSPGSTTEVTASPDFYLVRGGFIFKGSIAL
jgi:hypothetical protein